MKFAIVGLGFISNRHIKAIEETGNELVCACDINPDTRYKDVPFYTDFMEMTKGPEWKDVDYLSICTPNYLHSYQATVALNDGKKVIMEKPPEFKRVDYDMLVEKDVNKDINVVLQCRFAKELIDYKNAHNFITDKAKVKMDIQIHRGDWYMRSWKADKQLSGDLCWNIGVHYFDILSWFFGNCLESKLTCRLPQRQSGTMMFNNADVEWTLAIDMPEDNQRRVFEINGEQLDLTKMGFENLHTEVYKQVLSGNGFKLKDFKRTFDIISKIYA